MMGMFSSAVILWPQQGQAERGTDRLKVSVCTGSLPQLSAQALSNSRCIILGRR